MPTIQMRAQCAASGGGSEPLNCRWQVLRMATTGAARGHARLRIGAGPGRVSRPSVRPGNMPDVRLEPLRPLISYMPSRARPVSGTAESGNLRLSSLIPAYSRLMGKKCLRRRMVNGVQSCKMRDKRRWGLVQLAPPSTRGKVRRGRASNSVERVGCEEVVTGYQRRGSIGGPPPILDIIL